MPGDRVERPPVEGPERRKVELAKTNGSFKDRVEHRRKVARRAVDDPQHLGGCSLLLQSLARFCDEPRILDRDDRLRGKNLKQADLLTGERPGFGSGYGDRANGLPV